MAKHLKIICKRPGTDTGLKLYDNIECRQDATIIVRLGTAHWSLNQYLFRFDHVKDPRCECGEEVVETVKHYLLFCSKFDQQRDKLRRKVGVGDMTMEKLLGKTRNLKHTVQYVKETKRFGF